MIYHLKRNEKYCIVYNMKHIIKYLCKNKIAVFVSLSALLFLSCTNDLSKTDTDTAVTDIHITSAGNAFSIVKGDTYRLQAKVLPEYASDKRLSFSSSAEGIASVNAEGVITAHEEGNAVITIRAANGVQKTINVTVTSVPVPVAGIEFEEEPPTSLFIGETYSIKAKAQPDEATNKELAYIVDNNKADVAYDGTVTARSEGTVTITVKSQSNPEITKTVTITVKQKPEIKIEVKEVASNSDEKHPTFKVQTLHDKLDYTVEVVGDGKEWLSFDKKDSALSEEDTIHLKAKPNKTVWDRIAYIKFKDTDGKYIKGTDGNELEVTFTQKENKIPNVTIKWVYGIDNMLCQPVCNDEDLTTSR